MRSVKCAAFTGTAALAMAMAVTLPSAAATSATYHGYYDGSVTYAGCENPVPPKTLEGNWNVRISGDTATPSTNLFYDGHHHLAWGGKALDEFTVLGTTSGEVFRIRGDVAGTDVTVTMTLLDDGSFTYVVAPYPAELFGYSCDQLVLTGHQS